MAMPGPKQSSSTSKSRVCLSILLQLAFLLCLSSAWISPPILKKSLTTRTVQPSSTARFNFFDDLFNINKPAPAPAPAPAPVEAKKEDPKPAPVEEKKENAVEAKIEEPAPAPVEQKEEPAPVEAKDDEPAPVEEKKDQEVPSVKLAAISSDDSIHKGKVKWYNQQKGYGFIEPNDGSPQLFVHQTAIHKEGFRSLLKEEDVEFRIVEDEEGRTRAVDVTGPGGVEVQGAR